MRRLPTVFEHMRHMQNQMDKFFDELDYKGSSPLLTTDKMYFKPRADMWEEDNQLVAEFEIPGIDKEHVDINLHDNNIEIKAERNIENDDKKGYFERSYSGFYRSFSLPDNALGEQAKASFNNGILRLAIPKKQIENNTKKIHIE